MTIRVQRLDHTSTNRCQACPGKAEYIVNMTKPVGESRATTVVMLCKNCAGELREELPARSPELVEQQLQGDAQ